MELIDIVAGGLARRPVDGDAVPHLILNDQHDGLPAALSAPKVQRVGSMYTAEPPLQASAAGTAQCLPQD